MICSECILYAEIKFISDTRYNNCFPLSAVQKANKIIEFNKLKHASMQKFPV